MKIESIYSRSPVHVHLYLKFSGLSVLSYKLEILVHIVFLFEAEPFQNIKMLKLFCILSFSITENP